MAKSKPIGVRFDLYKLDMIQKEQNLTSVQQVVNYLMDNYETFKSTFEKFKAININLIQRSCSSLVSSTCKI